MGMSCDHIVSRRQGAMQASGGAGLYKRHTGCWGEGCPTILQQEAGKLWESQDSTCGPCLPPGLSCQPCSTAISMSWSLRSWRQN